MHLAHSDSVFFAAGYCCSAAAFSFVESVAGDMPSRERIETDRFFSKYLIHNFFN